jgi:hypothetical protein
MGGLKLAVRYWICVLGLSIMGLIYVCFVLLGCKCAHLATAYNFALFLRFSPASLEHGVTTV